MTNNLRIVGDEQKDSPQEPADEDLMLLLRANNVSAFEALFKRHHGAVLGFATRFLGNRPLGMEATQEVFCSLWEGRHHYRSLGRFRSYLLTLTFHRCQYLARQKRSHQQKLINLTMQATAVQAANSPLQDLISAEQRKMILEQLTELPARMRQVFILRFAQGYSLAEVGELTELPLGTVKALVFRGMKKLHKRLVEREP